MQAHRRIAEHFHSGRARNRQQVLPGGATSRTRAFLSGRRNRRRGFSHLHLQEVEQQRPGIGDAPRAEREDDVARRDDLCQETRRVSGSRAVRVPAGKSRTRSALVIPRSSISRAA